MANDSSTSSEELDATSDRFDALKALYSHKKSVAVSKAPLYDNLDMFLSAQQRGDSVVPVGNTQAIAQRQEQREKAREEMKKELDEKNKRRFTEAQALTPAPRRQRPVRNMLTRCEAATGPLAALRDCMENRVRVKVVTRHATGVRGQLIGLLEAFDKQWNMALSDVLEIWRRKTNAKRKIPPALGTACAAGTARQRAAVPRVTETRVGKHEVECTRHAPQLLVRGEHVVLVQIIERWKRKD